MKKNKVFKIAAALLLLCVMTTCVIGTTFAKYTSGDNGFDEARVAKWGVVVAADGSLFGKNYDNAIVAEGAASITVASNATDDVVAPGTKNESGFLITIAGQPEVDFTLSASTTGANNKDIFLAKGKYAVMVEVTEVLNAASNITGYYTLADGKYSPATTYVAGTKYYRAVDVLDLAADYYPVVWSVTNEGAAITAKKATEIANALVTAINGTAKQANDTVAIKYLLKWNWAIEDNNGADTILGHLQAGANVVVWDATNSVYVAPTANTNYCLDVAFNITVGATQVD